MPRPPTYQAPTPYAIQAEYDDCLRRYWRAASFAESLAVSVDEHPWLADPIPTYCELANAALADLTGWASRCTADLEAIP